MTKSKSYVVWVGFTNGRPSTQWVSDEYTFGPETEAHEVQVFKSERSARDRFMDARRMRLVEDPSTKKHKPRRRSKP